MAVVCISEGAQVLKTNTWERDGSREVNELRISRDVIGCADPRMIINPPSKKVQTYEIDILTLASHSLTLLQLRKLG